MPDVYVADLTGRFIICSDGLHGEVPDEQIAAIAAAHSSPQEAVDAWWRPLLMRAEPTISL